MGQWDRAIADYTRATKFYPMDIDAQAALATAYLNAGDKTRALETLDAVLRARPDNADALLRRARLNYEREQLDAAIADYTRAILLKPADAELYSGRGHARLKKGDKPGALADFSKAIELDPDRPA